MPPKTIKSIQDNLLPHIVCQCKVHFSCYWEDNNRGAFHFIKHLAGSEPRTHRGGGKCSYPRAPEGLGGAPAWGGGRHGECSGVGWCTGVGVEEEERRAGNSWHGVEMSLDNFNLRRAFILELITAGSNYKPTMMGVHH